MKIQIYALKNPVTDEVFYIGRTSVNYISRYGGHIESAYNPKGREYYAEKYVEFRRIASHAKKFPKVELLEETDVLNNHEAGILEAQHINNCKSKLTNVDYRYTTSPIFSFDLNGKDRKRYASVLDAKRELCLNTYETANLLKTLSKERTMFQSRLWSYSEIHKVYSISISKEVSMYTREGKLIEVFPCARAIVAKYPDLRTKIISQVCKGDKKTHGGYRFSYKGENYLPRLEKVKRIMTSLHKPILRFDTSLNFIKEYSHAAEVVDVGPIDAGSLSKACRGIQKTYKGFIWRYK